MSANKQRWWREYQSAVLGPEGATVEGSAQLLNTLEALFDSGKRRVHRTARSTRGKKKPGGL